MGGSILDLDCDLFFAPFDVSGSGHGFCGFGCTCSGLRVSRCRAGGGACGITSPETSSPLPSGLVCRWSFRHLIKRLSRETAFGLSHPGGPVIRFVRSLAARAEKECTQREADRPGYAQSGLFVPGIHAETAVVERLGHR